MRISILVAWCEVRDLILRLLYDLSGTEARLLRYLVVIKILYVCSRCMYVTGNILLAAVDISLGDLVSILVWFG